ncbi:MAG: exopolysaccharide biosynthesis protein [Saccharospirillaceae bacterium]|nr:exopolysaccharide biosynthesis protein [Pseudomonadales bacterium]NRB79204.1 exopolysaccharide biosynthesis protein [Saccharospirillaceae bacterium]
MLPQHNTTQIIENELNNPIRSSQIILDLVKNNHKPFINLRQILNQLGDRSFGFMLVIVTIISFIPFISVITGFIICLIGTQMILGMDKVKLPKVILDRQLSSNKVNKALKMVVPKIQTIETYIRPRWQFTNTNLIQRINAVVIVILGLINAVPLPLTNIAPAILIMIFGLALIEKDGMVQFITLISSVFVAVLLGSFLIF